MVLAGFRGCAASERIGRGAGTGALSEGCAVATGSRSGFDSACFSTGGAVVPYVSAIGVSAEAIVPAGCTSFECNADSIHMSRVINTAAPMPAMLATRQWADQATRLVRTLRPTLPRVLGSESSSVPSKVCPTYAAARSCGICVLNSSVHSARVRSSLRGNRAHRGHAEREPSLRVAVQSAENDPLEVSGDSREDLTRGTRAGGDDCVHQFVEPRAMNGLSPVAHS